MPMRLRDNVAKAAFLRIFATLGNVLKSAEGAGVGRRTVYHWLEDDARFKELYAEAREDALDRLEEEARRRAVDGVLEPVYQGGRKVGEIRQFSDTLLMLLLKSKRPDVFRDRHEHTGKDGGPVAVTPILVSYDLRMKPPEEPEE
jgi:AcrR family transcriptional regulator